MSPFGSRFPYLRDNQLPSLGSTAFRRAEAAFALLGNKRKTDSLRRIEFLCFSTAFRRAEAAFGLLGNKRKTDSLRRIKFLCFSTAFRRAEAAFGLLRNKRKTDSLRRIKFLCFSTVFRRAEAAFGLNKRYGAVLPKAGCAPPGLGRHTFERFLVQFHSPARLGWNVHITLFNH